MINADEHKNLLEQINELEKNSINYFDVEKEFFLIDSDNLSQVRPKLYGYSIQRTGIYEDDNLTAEAIAGLDGRGCYVYVDIKDGKITIKQDSNGCWGIYLFRHGDYFALSNSFFRLLNHVKFKYPLTVNRDYCHYLLQDVLCSHAYSETAINEIQLTDRSTVFHIDIANKTLDLEFIDYKEHSVPLDSQEGVAILDRWVEFWSGILRGIAQKTKFIQADLTGGYDSRMSFAILLHSGIDLNKIKINSAKNDSNPVYLEDYTIASQIAEHYGFKLNHPLPKSAGLNYSLSDIWNIDLYSQHTFSNYPYNILYGIKDVEKKYCLSGHFGELIRKNYYTSISPQKFILNKCSAITRLFSSSLSQELSSSIQTIIKSLFHSICNKYHIEDPNSIEIMQYLYHDAEGRNHFGKSTLSYYLKNFIRINPACDPVIQTLQLKYSKCPDYNSLWVLIFTRYAPDLLKFRFDKFHKAIDLESLVPFAQEINERFPLRSKNENNMNGEQFHLQPRDTQVEKILSSGRNNPKIPGGLSEACFKATFDSSKTYGLFTTYFDEELYRYASYCHNVGRDRLRYPIISITKVLEDVEISQRNHSPHDAMKHFLEQDFAIIHTPEKPEKIPDKFKRFLTARIDIQLKSKDGNFQILSTSDEKTEVTKPDWFQDKGIGYRIHSLSGKLTFVAKATVNGRILLRLRSLDIRDTEDKSKGIPHWIDYTKLTVNNEIIFDTLTPAWARKPYDYAMDAKANEEIKIEIEWLPHRSDT